MAMLLSSISTRYLPEIIEPSDGDKLKWGASTWYMLHTIAEKVDTEV